MHLRKLILNDAPLMLEWMHDADLTKYLRIDFSKKTLEECISFIENASDGHFAIADNSDEYLGTVSLKNIQNGSAEFAIVIRRKVFGTGIAKDAMVEIIDYGFNNLGLKRIYWCVNPANMRALHFYEKQNYNRASAETIPKTLGYSKSEIETYVWYQIMG